MWFLYLDEFSEKENVIYRINWRLTAVSTLKDFKGTFYNATVTGDVLLSLDDKNAIRTGAGGWES